MKFKISLLLLFCSAVKIVAHGQVDTTIQVSYSKAYDSLKALLESPSNTSFKKAVFTTENAYYNNRLEFNIFQSYIRQLSSIAMVWSQANSLHDYKYSDSANFQKNFSIYKVLKDTVRIVSPNQTEYHLLPYSYDFNDFFGHEDWVNMFVTKLLATNKGNCHSLPYLYKILADEIGATCWLSLAPNHIYIKNRCRGIGWYNTELTSGQFPIDAWITASGYIPLKAVQAGIYMDTLSNQQAIALCVLDLAKGYEFKTKNYSDSFILKCCDLVLQYYPLDVQATLFKAETLKRVYEKELKGKHRNANDTYRQMEGLYAKLFDLGYREMPEKMYMQWLQSVVKERDKYTNKNIKEAIQDQR